MDPKRQAHELLSRLTLEEKANLLSGGGYWTTARVERLGIPAVYMTDGPHGLRKGSGTDLACSVPATCFPTASAMAASWDTDLVRRVGAALGVEAQANDVQVLLGPGVNMKRSPLGGRNFEYFSEDPVLAGELAAGYITGVQGEGVGVSLKHFAANNQESERMLSDSIVDAQTLHELYLQAFEIAVTKARPWSLMMSYNKVNGTYATENGFLMQDTLRRRWGYDGLTLSDWGAVNDIVASVHAGLNLEMPGSGGVGPAKVVAAVRAGELDLADVDARVTKLLEGVLKVRASRREGVNMDEPAHHELAREAAAASIVLLKNTARLLPLEAGTVAVVGRFAKEPRYQGSGSSQVTPTRLDAAYDALSDGLGARLVGYAPGYDKLGGTTTKLLDEAVKLATRADTVVVFAGLPGSYESEGFDRTSIDLPHGHDQLIATLAGRRKRVVVVLQNGSAVAMPWARSVAGIVEAWLGGQAGGSAVADVLLGRVNPSGKLSETFPVAIEDTPAFPHFPGTGLEARYGEGLFTGYRHYDMRRLKPLFPFGHGLSYTTFEYRRITLSETELRAGGEVVVTVEVRNAGRRAGREVVQLYVAPPANMPARPVKQLRAFAKLDIAPGATATARFALRARDFSSFDARLDGWQPIAGSHTLLVGGSSADLPLRAEVAVRTPGQHIRIITRDTMLRELADHPRGKWLYDTIARQLDVRSPVHEGGVPMIALLRDIPLSRLVGMSGGLISDDLLDAYLLFCRHPGSLNPLYALPLLGEAVVAVAKAARHVRG